MNAVAESLAADYEQDFYAWARGQAELVRTRRFGELDLDNLAEEIESMGSEQLHALESHTFQALVHLLLLQFSPADDPRAHWMDELDNFRADIERRLRRSPSLRPRMQEILASEWPRARRTALRKLAEDGVRELPADCPYAVAELSDADWLPPREARS